MAGIFSTRQEQAVNEKRMRLGLNPLLLNYADFHLTDCATGAWTGTTMSLAELEPEEYDSSTWNMAALVPYTYVTKGSTLTTREGYIVAFKPLTVTVFMKLYWDASFTQSTYMFNIYLIHVINSDPADAQATNLIPNPNEVFLYATSVDALRISPYRLGRERTTGNPQFDVLSHTAIQVVKNADESIDKMLFRIPVKAHMVEYDSSDAIGDMYAICIATDLPVSEEVNEGFKLAVNCRLQWYDDT